jgi:hypothetical protein
MHKRGGARFLLAVPNILCAFHRQSRLKGMFQLGIYINSSKRLFDSRLCQQPEAGAGPSFLWRRGAAWTAALRRVGMEPRPYRTWGEAVRLGYPCRAREPRYEGRVQQSRPKTNGTVLTVPYGERGWRRRVWDTPAGHTGRAMRGENGAEAEGRTERSRPFPTENVGVDGASRKPRPTERVGVDGASGKPRPTERVDRGGTYENPPI